MKKISLTIMIMLISGLMTFTWGQVDVTFQVDMSEYDGGYAYTEVNLNGSFNDWCGSCIPLTDPEMDDVWSVTVPLDPGTWEYKFTLDGWNGEEAFSGGEPCTSTLGGFTNRTITVTETAILPVVCWNSCYECGYAPPEYDVTFSVDMNDYTGSYTNVYLSGNMNDWCGDCNQMLDPENDGIYEITLPLSADSYEYKFTVDNWSGQENFIGGESCTVTNFGFTNRLVVVSEPTTLNTVCWNSCTACGSAELTFQVDMNNQDVSPDGVFVAGSFQGWNATSTPMTDAGNGVYTYTTVFPAGTGIQYKFINGTNWEDVPGECSFNSNRYLTVPEVNTILDPVCYASCGSCEGGTSELLISEYAEGSSNNKYVEIYNGTGAPVDLSNYNAHRISNGGNWDENIYPLNGILQDGDVYVIYNSSADAAIQAEGDMSSALTYFNGNDAVGLSKNDGLGGWNIIDVVGTDGDAEYWAVAGIDPGTQEHTLVRKPDVCSPTTDWALSAGTSADDSQWIVYDQNYWDNLGFHNAVCGGTPVASAPDFSVSGGQYIDAFDLELSCATPDASIFYTLDGSDPDQSSMVYSEAISISSSIEVKAFAIAPGYGASFVASAAYEFPVEVANLADLRAAFDSKASLYKITGEVILTFQQSFRNQKYIQDATAGVLIDDNNDVITTTYKRYDGITGMIGSINEYGNMLQFVPFVDPGEATSSGNQIEPQVITLDELNNNFEAYESELVKIMGLNFDDAGGTFYNGNEYAVSDGSKAAFTFRTTFYNVDYINSEIPETRDVVGLPNSRFQGDYITSRDLVDLGDPGFLPMFYPNGWTSMSSNIAPGSIPMEDLFAPVYGSMVILLNSQGIFWPEFNVNTLGDWNPNSGYKVKFDGSTYFVFSGTPVESQVYAFEPGTVFVPVLSDGPVSVEELIMPLGGAVEFMFDLNTGSVYWPDGGIIPGVQGALETLEPGYAYLTKFNNSGEIDFGAVPAKAAPQQSVAFENNTSWNDVMVTGDQHIISISETALNDLEVNDVVGVFNSNGNCMGMAQNNGDQNTMPLVVYGDDMTTEAVDGMVEDESLTFRIYRHGGEIDAAAVYNTSIQNHNGMFALNGLSMVETFKLGATGIGDQNQSYSIYPNPGNGQFNIDVTGDFDVTVTNAQGQLIYQGRISGNSVINLTGQPEGIYFIRLTGESSSMIEKVIMK